MKKLFMLALLASTSFSANAEDYWVKYPIRASHYSFLSEIQAVIYSDVSMGANFGLRVPMEQCNGHSWDLEPYGNIEFNGQWVRVVMQCQSDGRGLVIADTAHGTRYLNDLFKRASTVEVNFGSGVDMMFKADGFTKRFNQATKQNNAI